MTRSQLNYLGAWYSSSPYLYNTQVHLLIKLEGWQKRYKHTAKHMAAIIRYEYHEGTK